MFSKVISILSTGFSCGYIAILVFLTPTEGLLLAPPVLVYAITSAGIIGGAVLSVIAAELLATTAPPPRKTRKYSASRR